jgi:hypothetical protein
MNPIPNQPKPNENQIVPNQSKETKDKGSSNSPKSNHQGQDTIQSQTKTQGRV